MRVPLKKSQPQEPKQLGRPRSETSRIAILEATMALLDKTSVRDITIEAIAREAGVGKVTIYRWWPTKIHLVVDAFMETMLPQTPFPESDAKFGAFAHHLAVLVKKYRGKYGRIVGEIIAEGQFDRDALTYFREALLTQRRAAARDIVDNAKTRGEIDNEIETDIWLMRYMDPSTTGYCSATSRSMPIHCRPREADGTAGRPTPSQGKPRGQARPLDLRLRHRGLVETHVGVFFRLGKVLARNTVVAAQRENGPNTNRIYLRIPEEALSCRRAVQHKNVRRRQAMRPPGAPEKYARLRPCLLYRRANRAPRYSPG